MSGTLFVLLGTKVKCLLVRHDWEALQHLWPALLSAQHSEKPSIATLLAQLVDAILKTALMIAITVKVSHQEFKN